MKKAISGLAADASPTNAQRSQSQGEATKSSLDISNVGAGQMTQHRRADDACHPRGILRPARGCLAGKLQQQCARRRCSFEVALLEQFLMFSLGDGDISA
eukprot:2844125-Pyramimonas_sp.AAC.1